MFPRFAYKLNAIPIKIPSDFLVKVDKRILKFIWQYKVPRIAKTTLKKKIKVGTITLPNFKTYYNAIRTRQCDSGIKMDIWINGTEQRFTEIDPYIYKQLIFDKSNSVEKPFQQMGLEQSTTIDEKKKLKKTQSLNLIPLYKQ